MIELAHSEGTPFAVFALFDRIDHPARGRHGGGDGASGDVRLASGRRLRGKGRQIVPAGDMTSGTGHHHLYLDADLTAPGTPVPTVPGSIIHMGDGSSTYTFEDLAPGEHRLIAVVADGVHVPLQPWVVDTLTFTVNN